MKMKISILLGMISVLLIGCNITKDDAGDALNESTESLETVSGIQDVDAGEGEESSQPEVQDPQEENPAGEGEESSQPEVQDPQEENPAGGGEESSQPEVQDPQEENSAGGGEESSQPEVQDPQEDNPAGEGNESSLSVEGCYDDPDNPVEDQNYNVGEPKYE